MPMFERTSGVEIKGGVFNDVGRDQHNTYHSNHSYGFQPGSNPNVHHYQPGTRVNHGATTTIGYAGNLNLGENHGTMIQNSGHSFSPPGAGYYGPPPPFDPGYWGYPPPGMPPYGMQPPWAQPPYSQPPTPHYGYPYPGDDDNGSYRPDRDSNNPYRQPMGSRSRPARQDTNPFHANPERTQSAPSEGGLSYVSDDGQRSTPAREVNERMANLRIDVVGNSSNQRDRQSRNPSPRQPRVRCETVDESDEEAPARSRNLPTHANDFNLYRG